MQSRVVAILALPESPPEKVAASDQLKWVTRTYFQGKKSKLRRFLAAFGLEVGFAQALFNEGIFDGAAAVERAAYFKPDDQEQLAEYSDGSLRDAVLAVCGDLLVGVLHVQLALLKYFEPQRIFTNSESIAKAGQVSIITKLWNLMGPTIAVEFNLYCIQSGIAPGDTSSVAAYVSVARTEHYQTRLFSKYPVLHDGVAHLVDNASHFFCEMIRHIAKDRVELERIFELQAGTRVTAIRFGLGDTHRGGRAVCMLLFGDVQIVYKPRSLAPEQLFNWFARWLAAKDASLHLRTLRVIERERYGYCESVSFAATKGRVDTSKFYRQMGILLAVSYVLGIADLHFENVIAVDGEPVPIDIESILLKPLRTKSGMRPLSELYCTAFADLLFHSLLLPHKLSTSDGVADGSAIGSADTPAVIGRPLVFERQNDGRTGFVDRIAQGVADNRPVHSQSAHEPFLFTAEVLAGYDAAVAAIIANASELRSKSFLASLANVPSRWIPRATREYTQLQVRMRHPSVLADSIERDFLAASLWTDEDRRLIVDDIIRSELADLQHGDVPYFSTLGSSLDIFDSAGRTIPNAFASSGEFALLERLGNLPIVGCAHRAAISAALESTRTSPTPPMDGSRLHKSRVEFDEHIALANAIDIANRLAETAHFVDGIPFWSGLHEVQPQNLGATVLLPTVYDGSLGIGLFIANLHRVAPSAQTDTITRGIHELTVRLLTDNWGAQSGSAFSGFGGTLYVNIVTSAVLGKEPTGYSKQIDLALARWSRREANCDFVGGLAGAMIVLQRIHESTKDHRALVRLISLRQQIIQRAHWDAERCYWKSPMFEAPLGGFAHGTAGIAWALASTMMVATDPGVDHVVEAALRHDESYYRSDIGTWIDGRNGKSSNYWCHGAAGIGLAAQAIHAMRGSKRAGHMCERAYQAVSNQGALGDDCMCHGTLGNAELLAAVGDNDKVRAFYCAAHSKFLEQGDWSCVGVGSERLSSLLCGTSGIGYQMLRFAAPNLVPNLLLLEARPTR